MMRRASLVALAAAAAWLALPGAADAARVAVGLEPGANAERVATAVERRTGTRATRLAPIRALVVKVPRGVSLNGIAGIRYVEPIATRRPAMTPNDPLAGRQWYLTKSRFFERWSALPQLYPVSVAVIDSGVDVKHPELEGRILDTKSFVGGSAEQDTLGHGTFVAGTIAAGFNNKVGIAGLAPSADLLVAKVVTEERSIPVDAVAKAVRWSVASGAQVINMSFGGVRDPLDPDRDSYSQLEADAIAYAISRGVVVVAAVGNGDQSPSSPWQYASYPAALPHVLGVSALNEKGEVPKFSNRDQMYNDLAAPGEKILSTFPRPLTSRFPACSEQGYSSCGPDTYREAQGTSFAAPVVSSAAALLLATRQGLEPEQVTWILQRSAVDMTPATGCSGCLAGRDELSGFGSLDVFEALEALELPLPAPDRFEANDGPGSRAYTLTGRKRSLEATVDFWDDRDDVYAIRLKARQVVHVGLRGDDDVDDLSLALWLPKTHSIEVAVNPRLRARLSSRPGLREHVRFRARAAGVHYVHVRQSSVGLASYRLVVVKRPPPRAQR
jgi:subtilisin family serine protease